MLVPKVSVVLSDGCSVGAALAHRLGTDGIASQVRLSPVLDSWDGLSDICRGADVVYLLSSLDLNAAQADKSALQDFRTGVSRVLECCQECGVGNLVFTSSASVVADDADGGGLNLADERLPFVSEKENPTAYAIAMAEAEVLKTSGTQNLGGSSCLYTCALRPAFVYGTGDDRALQRALSWVGYGLNRLALGPQDVQGDLVFAENLVEAQVLAGAKLMEATSGGGGRRWGTRGPVCSGQAYFITDGQPCHLQAFMDEILVGLDFSTNKILRLPTVVGRLTAWVAELMCKAGLASTPFLSRGEVKALTSNRTYSIARAREDLGYNPIVDPGVAMRNTAQTLQRDGWHRHTLLVPALGWWIANPLGIWLATLAGFGGPCPQMLAPLVRNAEFVGLAIFRSVTVVQASCWAAYIVHILEAVYAFRLAHKAGHRDTAPLWFLQTFILGFPSLGLLRQLLS